MCVSVTRKEISHDKNDDDDDDDDKMILIMNLYNVYVLYVYAKQQKITSKYLGV